MCPGPGLAAWWGEPGRCLNEAQGCSVVPYHVEGHKAVGIEWGRLLLRSCWVSTETLCYWCQLVPVVLLLGVSEQVANECIAAI